MDYLQYQNNDTDGLHLCCYLRVVHLASVHDVSECHQIGRPRHRQIRIQQTRIENDEVVRRVSHTLLFILVDHYDNEGFCFAQHL